MFVYVLCRQPECLRFVAVRESDEFGVGTVDEEAVTPVTHAGKMLGQEPALLHNGSDDGDRKIPLVEAAKEMGKVERGIVEGEMKW